MHTNDAIKICRKAADAIKIVAALVALIIYIVNCNIYTTGHSYRYCPRDMAFRCILIAYKQVDKTHIYGKYNI